MTRSHSYLSNRFSVGPTREALLFPDVCEKFLSLTIICFQVIFLFGL